MTNYSTHFTEADPEFPTRKGGGWYTVIECALVGQYHVGAVGEVGCGMRVHGKLFSF